MNKQDGQLIKDITATLRGGQPQHSPTGASSKTRHPGSQNLSSTRPALTQSSARAGHAVKDVLDSLFICWSNACVVTGAHVFKWNP